MIRGIGRAISLVAFGFFTWVCSAANAATYQNLAGPLIFEEDFETGSIVEGHGWIFSGNHPEVTTEVARSGKYSMKTYLNRLTSPKAFRTEVSMSGFAKVQPGQDAWYGFSIYLPKSYISDPIWEIVAQWHSAPDVDRGEDKYIQNPPLSLQTENGEWLVSTIWDSKPVTTNKSYEGSKPWHLGSYETGKWTDWVFHVKWSPFADGILEVWKDGVQVIDKQGPIGFNDEHAPFFKMGLYKGWTNPDRKTPAGVVSERTLYHDEIRMAGPGGSYADVAPGGGKGTSPQQRRPNPPSDLRISPH
jgi:hypothetical protein